MQIVVWASLLDGTLLRWPLKHCATVFDIKTQAKLSLGWSRRRVVVARHERIFEDGLPLNELLREVAILDLINDAPGVVMGIEVQVVLLPALCHLCGAICPSGPHQCCSGVYYCSVLCQRRDWQTHKYSCLRRGWRLRLP